MTHFRRGVSLAPLFVCLTATAIAQPPEAPPPVGGRRAYVRDAGPGAPGRILRDALARPHRLIVAPDTGITLPRDSVFATSLVIVGGPARVASRVRGDVIALGDLFLRPGADVAGRAVAIGGGVYPSALASVRGGTASYRDVTFDAMGDAQGALALVYRDLGYSALRTVTLPGVAGFRIPVYTRIDGLAITAGPEIALRGGTVRVEPLATYRTHLGALDLGVIALATLGRRTTLDARVERGTFTNDAWMRGDLVNSVVTLASGGDARNYYRADQATVAARRRFESTAYQLEPYVGARVERAWSAARDSGATSAPYSVFGRDNVLEGPRRPNPRVLRGTITSGYVGARLSGETDDLVSAVDVRIEAPASTPNDTRFAQFTADANVGFDAFADHRVTLLAHALFTAGDSAPPQRYAYLGGGPTLPSIPLLRLGGDRLLWTETRYAIPVERVRIPFLGSPVVTLRHMIGSAGIGRLPSFTQNLGLRLNLGALRADYTFDPTGRGDRDLTVGIGFR